MDSAVHMEPPDNIGDGQLRARQVLAYSIEPANLKKGAGRLMVYVISKDGQPLMPTERCGKVYRLLRSRKAKVIKRCPFTIQLLYDTAGNVQPVSLGVDAGSRHIGISATTKERELYAAEVVLRTDIVDLMSARRELRRARRGRKTRYRKPRFDNRTRSKHKGWLAPSVENKIAAHLRAARDVCAILPVSKIVVETASFDTQKLKADIDGLKRPEGEAYQQGEQLGFWNVREYVLFRDGHTCRCCKGKSGVKILNVHHIESRKTGGDAPNNLVTLCEYCHKQYHEGKVKLPADIRRGTAMRDAAFMGIMRWTFYHRLKALYPGMVQMTYGYITKNVRILHGLPKEHRVDARCISGHPGARPLDYYYYQKRVRKNNRQIHKLTVSRGGKRKRNQAPKYVYGYQLFDKVSVGKKEGFVFGRRSSGYFDIRTLDGTKLSAGISYRKLRRLEQRNTVLTERRPA